LIVLAVVVRRERKTDQAGDQEELELNVPEEMSPTSEGAMSEGNLEAVAIHADV